MDQILGFILFGVVILCIVGFLSIMGTIAKFLGGFTEPKEEVPARRREETENRLLRRNIGDLERKLDGLNDRFFALTERLRVIEKKMGLDRPVPARDMPPFSDKQGERPALPPEPAPESLHDNRPADFIPPEPSLGALPGPQPEPVFRFAAPSLPSQSVPLTIKTSSQPAGKPEPIAIPPGGGAELDEALKVLGLSGEAPPKEQPQPEGFPSRFQEVDEPTEGLSPTRPEETGPAAPAIKESPEGLSPRDGDVPDLRPDGEAFRDLSAVSLASVLGGPRSSEIENPSDGDIPAGLDGEGVPGEPPSVPQFPTSSIFDSLRDSKGDIDWESLLGKKLFAWVGAFAMFLAAALAVRHGVQTGVITIGVRIFVGFLLGAGCIVGGFLLRPHGYEVTVQSLCASGLAILFADFVGAHKYDFIPVMPTFLLLASVTAGAFFISVKLDSPFVSILGLVGGFLVPPILATNEDNPIGLFVYIALLNGGLLAVVLEKGWGFLLSMGAAGTCLTQIGWTIRSEPSWFEFPWKTGAAWWSMFGFATFFNFAEWEASNRKLKDFWISLPARLLPLLSLWMVAMILRLGFPEETRFQFLLLMGLLNCLSAFQLAREQEETKPFFRATFGISLVLTGLWWLDAVSQGGRLIPALVAGVVGGFFPCLWWGLKKHGLGKDILPAILSPLFAMVLTGHLAYAAGAAPGLVLGLLAVLAVISAWLGFKDPEAASYHIVGSLVSLGVISVWAGRHMTPETTWIGYAAFLGFSAFNLITSYLAEQEFPEGGGDLKMAGKVVPLLSMGFAGYLVTAEKFAGNPWIGFSLLFILDLGLAWEMYRGKKGNPFWEIGAVGNFLVLWAWIFDHLTPANVMTGYLAFFGFSAFYTAVWWVFRRWGMAQEETAIVANLLPIFSMASVGLMLTHPELGGKPLIVLSLLFLLDGLLAVQTLENDDARPYHTFGSLVVFLLLFGWTFKYLTEELLFTGLGFFIVFAVFHAALPIVLQRMRPKSEPYQMMHLFAPLMLLLMAVPVLTHATVSAFIWPAILFVNLIGLFAAWVMAWLWAGITLLVITMGLLGFWVHRISDMTAIPGFLAVDVFFSLLFHIWAHIPQADRKKSSLGTESPGFMVTLRGKLLGGMTSQDEAVVSSESIVPQEEGGGEVKGGWGSTEVEVFPALSAFLPFTLLLMVIAKIPGISNPSVIFAVVLLLAGLLLRLVQILKNDHLALVAGISVALIEFSWHANHFQASQAMIPTVWYSVFLALFLAFPFIFRKEMERRMLPWITSALMGPIQFFLLYRSITEGWGKQFIGFLPVVLGGIYLKGLFHLNDSVPVERETRMSLLALFGGVALFFLTVAFPVQFDREWLTIGWGLEGAALLWLFRRVPHPGLEICGTALLVIAFARLGLNPEVLSYHTEAHAPVFNWYLYSFGTVSAALLAGGAFSAPEQRKLMDIPISPALFTLGGILAFMLLNIEIADFFCKGAAISFSFSQSMEQNLAYSVGWILFGLTLLMIAIRFASKSARWTAFGLLWLTIAKVFFYDLADLKGMYRVASVFGVAIGGLFVSFLSQKYPQVRENPVGGGTSPGKASNTDPPEG